jgi:hypothetical protein
VLQSRQATGTKNLLSSIMYCDYCGATYNILICTAH